MEGSGYGTSLGVIPTFAWEKSQQSLAMILGAQAEI
jgi:hypothetical protein